MKNTPDWSSLKARLAEMKASGLQLTMSDTTGTFLTDVPGGVIVGADPRPAPVQQIVTETTSTTTGNQTGKFYTQEEVDRIRETEKSKLYNRIEEMKSSLDSLTSKEREREEELRKRDEELAQAAKEKLEKETDLRDLLLQKEREMQARIDELAAQAEASKTLLAREQEYSRIESYRAQAMAAEQNNIAPQLIDLISGNTIEEIDASIASLRARTEAIFNDMQQAQAQVRRDMPGVRVTAPGTGPLDTQTADQTFTAEQIAAMSMADYVKHRNKLLGGASSARSKGMFG